MKQGNIHRATVKAKDLLKEDRFDEAIELLEPIAYERDGSISSNKYILDILGRAYLKADQADLAIDLLIEYYEDESNNFDNYIYSTLAKAYMAEKEATLASDILEHIIDNNPKNQWAITALKEASKLSREQQRNPAYEPTDFSI